MVRILWPVVTMPGIPMGLGTQPFEPRIHQWFNEAALAVPVAGTLGNENRNQLTGPGLATTNLSLSKTFTIWEDVKLLVRGDANNAFNHPSFGLPANTLSVTSSGAIAPALQR